MDNQELMRNKGQSQPTITLFKEIMTISKLPNIDLWKKDHSGVNYTMRMILIIQAAVRP